jgi:rfaE bifunctional protein kinase chain/domain
LSQRPAPREPEQDVIQHIRSLVPPGRQVVFVSGNFNVVHPGHLRLMQFAAECGDYLVIGVLDDRSPGAKIAATSRLEGVKAISFVDYAFVLKEPPDSFIRRLRPAIVVKGKEHEVHPNPEQAAVDSYGGKLLFSSGDARFSSVDLLQREYFEANFSTVRKPADFPARRGFAVDDLKRQLGRFASLRVLVIGDLIVDEYVNCDPLGMSQEDPTIVVVPIEQSRFVGGAAIVSAHARGLGASVCYFGVAGPDEPARFARQKLEEYGVKHAILEDESRPTTLKQRYRAAGKTLLRVSHLRQHDIRPQLATRVLESVEAQLGGADLVIFSDFNYGCLPQSLVEHIIAAGKRHGIAMVADSQASSQLSDISRFVGMRLITPTEREARLALRDSASGLPVLAAALQQKAQAENVIITLGAEGAFIYARGVDEWESDQLPAFNSAPRDSAGAGDSLLASTAMSLCCGMTIWQSAYVGSLAAACQTSRVGNIPLTQADLITEIDLP